MIDNDKLRETVVTGIKNYLQIPFIQSNQNAEPPAYPFLSFTVTKLESENKGTWSEYDDGKDRQAVTQTWSISSLSDDENESITNASKAREWFDRVGRLYLKDNGVIVQSVGAITNRDNVLTTEYEYKNGFDVVFYMLSEVENPITESGQYIETAKIENIQAENNDSTLNDLIGVEDVSDPVKQIEIANNLGRNNLASKGVDVADNSTTYEIMEAIEQTEEAGSYDKGYSYGYEEGAEKSKTAFEDGKNAEKSAFWDTYQDNGNRRNYDYAFAGSGWTDELFDPKYPIVATSFQRMFAENDKITEIKVPLDFTNNDYAGNEVDFCFNKCSALKTVQLLKVSRNTQCFPSFDYCDALEFVGILGEVWYDVIMQDSDNLNDETLSQMTLLAKDFIHAETEEVQAMSGTIYLSLEVSDRMWTIEADERFPEEYQGMLLGEVLLEKGWTC